MYQSLLFPFRSAIHKGTIRAITGKGARIFAVTKFYRPNFWSIFKERNALSRGTPHSLATHGSSEYANRYVDSQIAVRMRPYALFRSSLNSIHCRHQSLTYVCRHFRPGTGVAAVFVQLHVDCQQTPVTGAPTKRS